MKTKYGQNFLNKKFAQVFVDALLEYVPTKSVLIEIGPGKGIITHIVDQLYTIICYEIDTIFFNYLIKNIVIWKCFLKNDINSRYFMGNLPFYCSKDIILNIVSKKSFCVGVFIVGDYFIKKHREMFNGFEVIRYQKIPGSSFFPACKFNAEILVVRRI